MIAAVVREGPINQKKPQNFTTIIITIIITSIITYYHYYYYYYYYYYFAIRQLQINPPKLSLSMTMFSIHTYILRRLLDPPTLPNQNAYVPNTLPHILVVKYKRSSRYHTSRIEHMTRRAGPWKHMATVKGMKSRWSDFLIS